MKFTLIKKRQNFLYGRIASKLFKAFDFSAPLDGAMAGHGELLYLYKKSISFNKKILQLSGEKKASFYNQHLNHFFLNSNVQKNEYQIGLIDKNALAKLLDDYYQKIDALANTSQHSATDANSAELNNNIVKKNESVLNEGIAKFDWELALANKLPHSDEAEIDSSTPIVLQTFFCAKNIVRCLKPNHSLQPTFQEAKDANPTPLAEAKENNLLFPTLLYSAHNHEFTFGEKILLAFKKPSFLETSEVKNRKEKAEIQKRLHSALQAELEKEEPIDLPQLYTYSKVISKNLKESGNIKLKTYSYAHAFVSDLQKYVENHPNNTKNSSIALKFSKACSATHSHLLVSIKTSKSYFETSEKKQLDISTLKTTNNKANALQTAEGYWISTPPLNMVSKKFHNAKRYFFFLNETDQKKKNTSGISFCSYENAYTTELFIALPLHIQSNHLSSHLKLLLKAVESIVENDA